MHVRTKYTAGCLAWVNLDQLTFIYVLVVVWNFELSSFVGTFPF